MDAPALLAKIQHAAGPADVLARRTYRAQHHAYLKLLHPDVCALPGAADAAARLNAFADQLKAQDNPADDAGPTRRLSETTYRFEGDAALLDLSARHHQRLAALPGAAAQHFRQYLPAAVQPGPGGLAVSGPAFVAPLTGLVLPPAHVAWVLNRLLEVVAWLHQEGYVHGGLTPESVWLVPGTHGVVLPTLYHLAPVGAPLRTAPARYLAWVPPAVLAAKQVQPYLDVAMALKIALYLLGDPSGHGVKLKKTVDERLVNFLIAAHTDAFQTLAAWRVVLRDVYGPRQFHPLTL